MIETSRAGTDKIDRWPVLRSLQGYRLAFLTSDLVAGITLAAIAIPEQLATARLGGFSPQIGFFAFLAGSLAFAIFGSNRLLSSGADSTITPIFAGGLALLAVAGSPEYAALAGVLALMVGSCWSPAAFSVSAGSRICCRFRSRSAFSPASPCTS